MVSSGVGYSPPPARERPLNAVASERAFDGHLGAQASATLPAALRRAAVRVLEQWDDRTGDATPDTDVPSLLARLVEAVADPQPSRLFGPELRSALGRRLLEVLRAETVAQWRQADEVSARQMLPVLEGFEAAREALEPAWDEHLVSRLAGPGSLELVVEVVHDLRSPLTSILFLAETLQSGQSGPVTDLQRRQLGLVYSAALGLSTLASDVLEMARRGNRLAEGEPGPFSITDILDSICDIVRPMAEEKGLEIRYQPPEYDHRVGYAQALSRILLNLTTNALKFTEEGFVEIETRERGRSEIEFAVRDPGRGIPPEALRTLYLPFRKADGDRYAFSGTGLGLALCRRLVEAMGSELEVETRPDWGTRFSFVVDMPAAKV